MMCCCYGYQPRRMMIRCVTFLIWILASSRISSYVPFLHSRLFFCWYSSWSPRMVVLSSSVPSCVITIYLTAGVLLTVAAIVPLNSRFPTVDVGITVRLLSIHLLSTINRERWRVLTTTLYCLIDCHKFYVLVLNLARTLSWGVDQLPNLCSQPSNTVGSFWFSPLQWWMPKCSFVLWGVLLC